MANLGLGWQDRERWRELECWSWWAATTVERHLDGAGRAIRAPTLPDPPPLRPPGWPADWPPSVADRVAPWVNSRVAYASPPNPRHAVDGLPILGAVGGDRHLGHRLRHRVAPRRPGTGEGARHGGRAAAANSGPTPTRARRRPSGPPDPAQETPAPTKLVPRGSRHTRRGAPLVRLERCTARVVPHRRPVDHAPRSHAAAGPLRPKRTHRSRTVRSLRFSAIAAFDRTAFDLRGPQRVFLLPSRGKADPPRNPRSSGVVGRRGLEPLTPCASCKCATNCANGP